MLDIDYFAPVEFTRCIPTCSKEQMDKDFLKRLNKARRIAGIPFILSSCFRSVDWEKSHSRTGNSFHTKGRAADIKCLDSSSRAVIVSSLIRAGFNGIGISNTFIHVDDRPLKCMWLYE